MKQKLIPLVSIIVGIIAFVMTFQYLRGERRRLDKLREKLLADTQQVRVVAASTDIPAGTVIKRSDLGWIYSFKRTVGDRAVRPEDVPTIVGRKARFRIKAENPIFWTDIEGVGREGRSLASIVNPGLRALSISVGGAAAVSSMVRPNDHVDILGTFSFPSRAVEGQMETVTLTVLQDVTSLATGQTLANQLQSSKQRRGSSGFSTVTVEVTPREAELLVFAQQARGRLVLSLRNASDVHFEKDLPEIDLEYLEKELPKLNLLRQRNIRGKKHL